ncbi:MAG: sensor histidine kinase [Bdellovibrionaceae bacterium]|nr:sensor histidine kinase [Pseudobdellovibrionaceae bacterium]
MDQLITNLLTNALKFSDVTESVEVKVENDRLIVKDAGPGIPPEVLERIGQPFNVGPDSGEGATGNGLGLAFVSAVTKLYQWRLEIRGAGRGAEISILFPRQESTSL